MDNSIVLIVIITLYFFVTTTRCTETLTDNAIASKPAYLSGGQLIDNNRMCSEQK